MYMYDAELPHPPLPPPPTPWYPPPASKVLKPSLDSAVALKTYKFGLYRHPETNIPCDQADQSLDPENSSSDAWTGIYPFPMGAALAASGVEDVAKCGYGRTLPIPRCVGCSGACGIIFSNIPLTHAYSTCQENWHLIRNRLAHSVYDYPLTAEESSVFLVVQHLGLLKHAPEFNLQHVFSRPRTLSSIP